MLINARHADELRVAIIENGVLEAYEVEAAESGMRRGNIYRGVVAKVESSLNAAFIDYGAERHGFLPGDDIVPEAYHRKVDESTKHPPIASILQKGQPILVQVTKEAIGQKGAALTTNLSIAGRYMVLTPFDGTRGVSRKVEDEKARKKLRKQLGSFSMPDGCGVIARTNALDQLKASLNRDLNALLRLWRRLDAEASKGKGPRLLYSDQDLVLQALRDFLDTSIKEVYVDDDTVHRKAEDYMRAFMPRAKTQLIRYEERIPLFARFHLDEQIARIYDRTVELPSGGSIVIDGTEALTAIDVNSGKTRGGTSHEDTVARTNVEAAKEVARQLRMRDIGGLVVVDFIDMRQRRNHRKVEKTLRDALKVDRARASIGRISDNGLLEINRQRVKQALELRTHRACPTCSGSGVIASPEFVALGLLRRIEARAAAGDLKAVRVALHPELADGFQNHRRQELAALEREFDIQIEVIAATHLHRSDEVVEWKRRQLGKHDPDIAPRPAPAALTASDVMSDEDAAPTRGKKRRRTAKRPEKDKKEEKKEAKDAESPEGRADEATEKRPRRRRRGGRRRKKSSGDAAVAAEAGADSVAAKEEKAPSGAESAPAAGGDRAGQEAGAPPAKKRRPRRRRGRGRKGEAGLPPDDLGNRLPPSEQGSGPGGEVRWPPSPPIFARPDRPPAVGWHTLFDGDDGETSRRDSAANGGGGTEAPAEESRPAATKRSRPARKKDAGGEAQPAAEPVAEEASAPREESAAPPATRTRRPRRTKKAEEESAAGSPESETPAKSATKAVAEEASAPQEESAARPAARTRRPRKTKKADEEPAAGSSEEGASKREATKAGSSRKGSSRSGSSRSRSSSTSRSSKSGSRATGASKSDDPEPAAPPPSDPALSSRPKGWPPLPGSQGE